MLVCRDLGEVPYEQGLAAMQAFTAARDAHTADEVWAVTHPPVFTQGRAGQASHVLAPGDIPVVPSDRGGQVTYHGPGQLVVYVLLDVRRLGVGPRELVRRLEAGTLEYLAAQGIAASRRPGAPGVYVGEAKIASLGLRIRRGYSYHGVALNVTTDLEPFRRINPCGYAGLTVTRLADLGGPTDLDDVRVAYVRSLTRALYDDVAVELAWRSAARPVAA